MPSAKWYKALLLALALLLSAQQVALAEETVSDVSERVMCMCGCGSLLGNCLHPECGSSESMTAYITDALARGESGDSIVAFFVSQYGEEVLSTPPKRGFNLLAWIMPVVALLLGGGIVYLVLTRWVRHGDREAAQDSPQDAGQQDEAYRERLEKELSSFSGRSFR